MIEGALNELDEFLMAIHRLFCRHAWLERAAYNLCLKCGKQITK